MFEEKRKFLLSVAIAWLCCHVSATAEQNYTGDTVHLIFSNHLDIGFDGISPELGIDNVIINKYFQWYFPLAVRLGKWFDAHPGPESHVYTTFSYLASLYMNCPPGLGVQCPTDLEKREFVEACHKGHITWTALPWNGQAEFMDPLTLGSATHVTFYLDADIGVAKKTVVSQRDVPGLSRAAIPVLVNEGVRAISVGVNEGSAPPDVPLNRPFVWRDPTSGARVMAFWHPFGYGGEVPDRHSPWGKAQLTPAEDCVKTPPGGDGTRHILCFSWRGDNSGPYRDPDEVLHIFQLAREQFPSATVRASTFEAFVDQLQPFIDELPVFEREIGDTWIYGIASDPAKSKDFKAIMRMRSKCLLEESCTAQDLAFRNFTRFLLKVPEHTWGIDSKYAPGDWQHWDNAALQEQLRTNPMYRVAVDSWARQAAYIRWGMEALDRSIAQPHLGPAFRAQLAARNAPHPVEAAIDAGTIPPLSLARCKKPLLRRKGAAPLRLRAATRANGSRALLTEPAGDPRGEEGGAEGACDGDELVLDTADWHIRVDPETGVMSSFVRKWTDSDGNVTLGTDWAANGAFGQFLYSVYDEAMLRDWDVTYNPGGAPAFNSFWQYDFGKPGADAAGVPRQDAHPRLTEAYKTPGPSFGEEMLVLRFNFEPSLVANAGAPANVSIIIHTWAGTQTVMMDAIWKDKPPTRLPEALWMRFSPDPAVFDGKSMQMWKVGSLVSPLDVVRNGSHNLHAVGDGGVLLTSSRNSWEVLQVVSLDAPLLAVGEPTPLPDIVGPANVSAGLSFCMTNNVWGTNYVMWFPYDEKVGVHLKLRFMLTVRDSRLQRAPHWHLSIDEHFADVPQNTLL